MLFDSILLGLLFVSLPMTQYVHWVFSYIVCRLQCLISLLGVLGPFAFLGLPQPFSNPASQEFLLTLLGFPSLITLYLILGANGSSVSPLLSLLALLWAYYGSFSLFYLLPMCLILPSFRAHSSLFDSSRLTLWACEPFIPATWAQWLFLAC